MVAPHSSRRHGQPISVRSCGSHSAGLRTAVIALPLVRGWLIAGAERAGRRPTRRGDLLGGDILRMVAGSEVVARVLGQPRLHRAAHLGSAGAPRMKATPGRRTHRVRWLAADDRTLAGPVLAWIRDWNRSKQRRGVGMDRL